jgi:HD-GYP domain-containing protein (c-di-GMP phosphodiesterase class II)
MPQTPAPGGALRLAEWMGALSLAADTANGFPAEKVLRTVLIADAVAARIGLDPVARRRAWWMPLLRYLGCTGFAHEEAVRYGAGDDQATRHTMVLADEGAPLQTVLRVVRGLAPEASLWERAGAVVRILGDGRSLQEHAAAQCEAATRIAEIAAFEPELVQPLSQICERWDGRGQPDGLRGEAVDVAVRLYRLADVAEVVWHREGPAAVARSVAQRSGGQLDPQLCSALLGALDEVLAPMTQGSVWQAFLDSEPRPHLLVGEERLDAVCRAFACFVDLKTTWTIGHSTGVARLADKAAVLLGLPSEERKHLHRAALLHDLGRLVVPNAIWDKPGPLGPVERERVRQHAYSTERILAHSPVLAPVLAIARSAHERLDGGGYHRGVPRALLPLPALILAAADVCCALLEPRPHRPAFDLARASEVLAAEVVAGHLDAEAVRAVLMAAGAAEDEVPSANPSGLTDREVEILVLLARGRTNRQIAAELGISPKTVQHHVAHVYDKIGAKSRAGAALFAVERGLVGIC